MASDLPIAFVTFKRVVLTTLASCGLNVDVTRTGSIWTAKLDDGIKMIGIPVRVGQMVSEDAAAGFARAALAHALAEFDDNDGAAKGTVQ